MAIPLIPPELAERCETACAEAVRRGGFEKQARQAQEELAELTAAINQFYRGREGSLEDVLEEAADVLLCMVQLRLMFGDGIDQWIRKKLERIEQRVASNDPRL